MTRKSWQPTQPTQKQITEFKTQMKILLSQRPSLPAIFSQNGYNLTTVKQQ